MTNQSSPGTSQPSPGASQLTLLVPLVGAYFRPPASRVLAHLPAGAQLFLIPEPDNPYDDKAIKVCVWLCQAVPDHQIAQLTAELDALGFDYQELATRAELLQLGYLADSDGKLCNRAEGRQPGNREAAQLAAATGLPPNGPWPAKLTFATNGKPLVQFASRAQEDTFNG